MFADSLSDIQKKNRPECSFQVDKEDLLKAKKSEGLGRKQQTSLPLFADSMVVTEKIRIIGCIS